MTSRMNAFQDIIQKSIETKQALYRDVSLMEQMNKVCDEIVTAYRRDNKVLLCGNGGSAADAQHISAELSGKFYFHRPALFAEALHVNTSYITAVANDYSYADVYARLIEGMGRKGDVLIGISTSGNSENVIKAMQVAAKIGMITVGLTGWDGGKMKDCSQYLLAIPSKDTPRVQECHILLGHIICEFVEKELFAKQ